MEGLAKHIPELEDPCPICLLTKATKISRGLTTDVLKFAPGSMLQMDFSFLMLKASVGLPQLLWLFALLLRTPMDSHPEASVHLLKS